VLAPSAHRREHARPGTAPPRVLDGASYVGVGPTFPSGTKEFEELAGPEFVRAASAETSLPAFLIGGVGPATIDRPVEAGARVAGHGRSARGRSHGAAAELRAAARVRSEDSLSAVGASSA
jgi:thiamine-phosphate pyrophosphorylase